MSKIKFIEFTVDYYLSSWLVIICLLGSFATSFNENRVIPIYRNMLRNDELCARIFMMIIYIIYNVEQEWKNTDEKLASVPFIIHQLTASID